MPATSPSVAEEQQAALAGLGARIRDHRKGLRISAVACAEASGVSRATLHRVEAGNPSVTIGAYINVAAALGLQLLIPLVDRPDTTKVTVKLLDYPALRQLAWQADAGTDVTEVEALNLYERGWRHLERSTLTDHEKLFIQHLADTYSHGALLV